MKRGAWIGLVLGCGTLSAQPTLLQERMQELPVFFGYDPGKMESAGRQILQQREAVSCDSLLIGEFLVVQAAVARRVAYCDMDTVTCGEAPPLLLYVRAAHAHLCNRYEEAVEGFRRVADGTDSRKLAVAALQAAGVVHSDAGDAEKALACLVEAFERFPEECGHPLALLNLAGAASMVGQWEAVLKWSDLAEEAMKRESAGSKASEVDPQWQALIQGSRLLAFMKLGRTAEADAVFLHMPLRDLKVVGAVGVLSNYTSYALQQDAFVHFVGHLPELQAIALLDSSATVRQMGAYATLFEPWRSDVWGELPLEDVWAQVRAMPANLGDQARIGAEREPKGAGGAASGRVFLPGTAADRWKIAAAALFLLAVGGTVRAWQLWRARRRAQGWSAEREAELMASLRSEVAGLRGAPFQAGARWLLMEVLRRRGLSRLLSLGEGMRQLTRREQEFIIHLAAGLRTKEFARIHRLSASYVYNLSHSIRRKLYVPEAVELPDWIASHQRKGE